MSKLQILVGSVTGNAEAVAETVAEIAHSQGHQVSVNTQADLDDLVRDPEEVLLLCTSNTGAGDLPDNLQPLYLQLTRNFPAVAGRRYGLINLGDSSYITFGEAGQALDEALADLGAQRLGEPLMLDACEDEDPEEAARPWMQAWLETL